LKKEEFKTALGGSVFVALTSASTSNLRCFQVLSKKSLKIVKN